MKLEIYCEDRPWQNYGVGIWIVGRDSSDRRFRVKPLDVIFEPMEDGSFAEPLRPTIEFAGQMSREFFPALIDALERSGHLRPKKDDSVAALQAHITDLQKIVHSLLERRPDLSEHVRRSIREGIEDAKKPGGLLA